MAIIDGLKTRVLLATRNIQCDLSWVLLNSSQGGLAHLFIECNFNMQIWNFTAVKFDLAVNFYSLIVENIPWLAASCDQAKKDNMTLAKLCYPAIMWNIWQEGCNRMFGNSRKPLQCILEDIASQIRCRAIFLNLDVSPALAASWNLPPPSIKHEQIIDMLRGVNGDLKWNLLISVQVGFSAGFF